jgi:hypothetical protein
MSADDFKLERYKYIVGQQAALNENVHKYLLFYQTLVSAILGGVVAFIVKAIEHKISRDIVAYVINGAGLLLGITSAFTFLLVFSGLASWIDYRKEECELLDEVVRPGFRDKPRLHNFWRWPEVYVLAFMVLASGAVWCALRNILTAMPQ